MAKPELKVNGGIYVFSWAEYQLAVKLDRFREDSRQTLSAEATVQTTQPGVPNHVHQARLNLTSTTARNSLAKYLHDRLNTVPWNEIVEQFSVMALRRYREGEPVVQARDIPMSEALHYRIKPVIINNQVNVIYGDGAVGKTSFAIMLGTLVAEGTNLYDTDSDWFWGEPGNVLFLDYETSAEEFKMRTEMIQRGLGYDKDSNIYYRFCFQPLAADLAEVQRIVAELNIAFIIVDSMGLACGDEPEKAQPVIDYFRAIRSLRITSLTIDHNNKEGKQYGNNYKFHYARNIWEAKKVQEPGDDNIYMGLFHKKINNGKLFKPLGFNIQFSEEAVTFKRMDINEVPEFEEGLPLKDRIKALLKTGMMPQQEIVETLGLEKKSDTVRMTLNRYKDKVFLKLGNNWGLKHEDN